MIARIANASTNCAPNTNNDPKAQSTKNDFVCKVALAALSLCVASLLVAPWQITGVLVVLSMTVTALLVLSLLPDIIREGFKETFNQDFNKTDKSIKLIRYGDSKAYKDYKHYFNKIKDKITFIEICEDMFSLDPQNLKNWAMRKTAELERAYDNAHSEDYARSKKKLKSQLEASANDIKKAIKEGNPENSYEWLMIKIQSHKILVKSFDYSHPEFTNKIKNDEDLNNFVEEQVNSIIREFQDALAASS